MILAEEKNDERIPPPPAVGAVLLCAATRWEISPLVRSWGLKRASENLFEGTIGGRAALLLKTGIGKENVSKALQSLETAANQAPARLVCSIGFAGALQPEMKPGDLVADLQGSDLEVVEAAREIAAGQKAGLHFGRILHSDTLVASPKEKTALGAARRAGAVDMETAVLRSFASRNGLPFYAVRVILDAVDESLPRPPSGEDAASLARYALENIGRLPWLFRLGLRQRRCMAVLGSFLEEFLRAP